MTRRRNSTYGLMLMVPLFWFPGCNEIAPSFNQTGRTLGIEEEEIEIEPCEDEVTEIVTPDCRDPEPSLQDCAWIDDHNQNMDDIVETFDDCIRNDDYTHDCYGNYNTVYELKQQEVPVMSLSAGTVAGTRLLRGDLNTPTYEKVTGCGQRRCSATGQFTSRYKISGKNMMSATQFSIMAVDAWANVLETQRDISNGQCAIIHKYGHPTWTAGYGEPATDIDCFEDTDHWCVNKNCEAQTEKDLGKRDIKTVKPVATGHVRILSETESHACTATIKWGANGRYYCPDHDDEDGWCVFVYCGPYPDRSDDDNHLRGSGYFVGWGEFNCYTQTCAKNAALEFQCTGLIAQLACQAAEAGDQGSDPGDPGTGDPTLP